MTKVYMFEEYRDEIIERIGEKRFLHSLRVADCAKELAKIHNCDENKAYTAGFFHDCGKIRDLEKLKEKFVRAGFQIKDDFIHAPQIIHSYYGAYLTKKRYNIDDDDIINAITFHTTGRANMSDLEKIIFLADYIEPMRNFSGVDKARELAKESLDEAMLFALDNTLLFLIKNGEYIAIDTVKARNYYKERR